MDVAMEDENDRAMVTPIALVGIAKVLVESPGVAGVRRELEARCRGGSGAVGHVVTVPAMR